MAPRKGSKLAVDRSEDIAGQRFGMLVAVRQVDKTANGTWRWLCACDCGAMATPTIVNLKRSTTSCGCIKGKQGTHQMTLSRTYRSWRSMKARCTNPKNPDWHNYGGRGITYDPVWESFERFYADMGDRPAGKTLDRERVNEGYSKANCRWATPREQSLNRRCSRTRVEAAEGAVRAFMEATTPEALEAARQLGAKVLTEIRT